MLRPWVRLASSADITEYQGVTSFAAMVEPKARKTGLATLEVLSEIDEDGCHPLAIPRDFLAHGLRVEKVAVQHKFLSDVVMQHLRHFEAGQRRADLVRDTLPDHLNDDVGIGKIERSKLIGAAGVDARRNIVDGRPVEPWRGRGDQPLAFGGAGEARNRMDDRARRKHVARRRGRA